MSKSDIALSVRGLSKAYTIAHEQEKHVTLAETLLARLKDPLRRPKTETFWALKDIEFDIKKGDVVGIIGRNGAGKSTLLKILSRITEPTTGRIDLYGRVGSLLEVGTGFHPELTGRENIFLNGAILGMTKAEIRKQFDAIVDFAGVEQFLDTPVKRYSSGMYVRLAFAVSAHLESEVLIIDEVLAVGDAEFQRKCLGKMKDVANVGRTVLFVSHNMAAVRSLCKKCLFLRRGKVMSFGVAEDTIGDYLGDMAVTAESIKAGLDWSDPSVGLSAVEINGSEATKVHVGSGETILDLKVRGTLRRSQRMDVEVLLTDMSEVPLAFFSPGHTRGVSPVRPIGDFEIHHRIKLPDRLSAGEYAVSLALTSHNENYWARLPHAARIIVEGTSTSTGRPLEYRDGRGFIFLDSLE